MTAIDGRARRMLNKVPEVTVYFWVIKVLCTTVGETFADYLNDNLGLGLSKTTYVMSAALVIGLIFQFRLRKYVPGVYWLAVVLISVVGTLITDTMVENWGVSLPTSTTVFSIVLALTFAGWYASERTLSIHTIVTTRRESWYWLTVLFTFALGTATGDLVAEKASVGYWPSALLWGGAIALIFAAHRVFKMNAVLSFWLAYILTRPLGASLGDGFSQARHDGGLGLGTTTTSVIFLAAILATVVYLSITRRDRIEGEEEEAALAGASRASVLVVANKTAAGPTLARAVHDRATRGQASFFLLVPNPDDHLVFDRHSRNVSAGEQILAHALPVLSDASGVPVDGRVSTSPNAYDDIEAEISAGDYHEVIISTLPGHVSHWLHIDLPSRVKQLGIPGDDGHAGLLTRDHDGVPEITVGVLEDDAHLRSVLERALTQEGFRVRLAGTGHEAISVFTSAAPDVLVLDIGLPDADGRDVCQALRVRGVASPVIFLTARDALTDRLSGFHVGADDYVTKPFAVAELVARIRVALRRGATPAGGGSGLEVDPVRHAASLGERAIDLTPTEFRLLAALAAKPGGVVRRNELRTAAWPEGAIVHDNTIDTYIRRLRRKLGDLGAEERIETLRGVGYVLR